MADLFNPERLRLEQLSKQMRDTLELLSDIESSLAIADTPLRRAQLRRDADHVRTQYDRQYTEYQLLAAQLHDLSHQAQQASEQLDLIHSKLDSLSLQLDEVATSIISQFSQGEQRVVTVVLERLTEEQRQNTKAVLESLDNARVTDQQTQDILGAIHVIANAVQEALASAQTTGASPDAAVVEAARILDDPKIEAKHKLKVLVPIIPLILSYEGELGLNVSGNVRAAVERLKVWWERIRNAGGPSAAVPPPPA